MEPLCTLSTMRILGPWRPVLRVTVYPTGKQGSPRLVTPPVTVDQGSRILHYGTATLMSNSSARL